MDCVHYKTSDPTQYNNNGLEHIEEEDNNNKGGIYDAWTKISNRRSFTSGDKSHKILERKKSQVLLEGYVESPSSSDNQEDLTRSKSLTDDDLEDLKGCLDLGFGFSYDEIPELCNTLPALELCYSMSQKFLDNKSSESSSVDDSSSSHSPSPIANWKFSSPGDNPDDVKARLKYWAQAVACTVQLCS